MKATLIILLATVVPFGCILLAGMVLWRLARPRSQFQLAR